jgi:hypothetical protein
MLVFQHLPGRVVQRTWPGIVPAVEGDTAHFLLLTLWDSLEAIRALAGPDVHAPD